MFAGFAVAMAVAWSMGSFDELFTRNSEPVGVLVAAVVMFLVGFVDDVREISAPAKVVGTVVVAVALVYFGYNVVYAALATPLTSVSTSKGCPLILVLIRQQTIRSVLPL